MRSLPNTPKRGGEDAAAEEPRRHPGWLGSTFGAVGLIFAALAMPAALLPFVSRLGMLLGTFGAILSGGGLLLAAIRGESGLALTVGGLLLSALAIALAAVGGLDILL